MQPYKYKQKQPEINTTEDEAMDSLPLNLPTSSFNPSTISNAIDTLIFAQSSDPISGPSTIRSTTDTTRSKKRKGSEGMEHRGSNGERNMDTYNELAKDMKKVIGALSMVQATTTGLQAHMSELMEKMDTIIKDIKGIKSTTTRTDGQTKTINKLIQKTTTPIHEPETAKNIFEFTPNPNKQKPPTTYAQAASKTTINQIELNKINTPKTKSKPPKSQSTRIVAIRNVEEPSQTLSMETLIRIRDICNQNLATNTLSKNIVITAVKETAKRNLILTLRADGNATEAMKFNSKLIESINKIVGNVIEIREDTTWGKAIVHGVSTTHFGHEGGMKILQKEIEDFNLGIKLMQEPRWLTSEEKREGKRFSSVILAVKGEEEAVNIGKRGVMILGTILRSNRFHSVKATDQCSKCQQFGHHNMRCTNTPKCRNCGKPHSTEKHLCPTCDSKKPCEHMPIKCANCNSNHRANDKQCEAYKEVMKREGTRMQEQEGRRNRDRMDEVRSKTMGENENGLEIDLDIDMTARREEQL